MKVAFVSLKPIKVKSSSVRNRNGQKTEGHIEDALALAEDCCWALTRTRSLPGGLLACASQMEDAFFFDLSIEPPEDLEALKPDLIVYPLIPYWPTVTKRFHSGMSSICRDTPKIVLAVPPGYMEDYARLRPNPFCVIYSEPERIFSEFDAETLEDLVEWRAHSQGTAWVDDEGYHQTEPLSTCIHDIKGTDWDLVPPFYWFYYDRVIYQFTRGCPYRCRFCVWGGSTVTDRTFRMRPAEQVATDLASLRGTINKYLLSGRRVSVSPGLEDVELYDPIPLYALSAQMTTDLGWIREYHALVQDDPYPFQGNINLRELTEEKIELLTQAGVTAFSAGLEALTEPLLEKLGKPHSFEDIIRSIKILNKANVRYYLKMISGGYGETKDEIRECLRNIEIMRERGIKHSRIVMGGPIIYYKGTVIGDDPPKELAYDKRHAAYRQKHIHVDEWMKVTEKLREYNLLDETVFLYPQKRLYRNE